MKIRYDIRASIANKNTGTSSTFSVKTLEADITAPTDALLYDNHHIVAKDVYLFDVFKDEVQTYSTALGVPVTDLEFDSFEVIGLDPSDKYQVYFEFDGDKQKQDLRPTIKVYIAPKNKALDKPLLKGAALDQNTILWSWDDDGCAHYLIIEAINPDDPNDKNKIIAQLPIGVSEYAEIGLEPGTAYTRRLIAYTDEQYSEVSAPCTTWTETATPDITVKEYETPRLYDFTIDESQRDIIEERMKAFHSGIGDFLDLKVYKQMDADFYQKFKAYFEITGRRVQRERRYEQVGFWYKVCLDAMERIEEQEGEVTFDVYAYPREWLRLEDYVWATEPVTIKASFSAEVFIVKEEADQKTHEITIYKPILEDEAEIGYTQPVTQEIPIKYAKPFGIIIGIDMSTSMGEGLMDASGNYTGKYRVHNVADAIKKFINAIELEVKTEISKQEYEDHVTYNGHKLTEITNPDGSTAMIRYIVYIWGGGKTTAAKLVYDGTSSQNAINTMEQETVQWYTDSSHRNPKLVGPCGNYTNFYKGFEFVQTDIKSRNGVADLAFCTLLFFTDGYVNLGQKNKTTRYSGNSYAGHSSSDGQCVRPDQNNSINEEILVEILGELGPDGIIKSVKEFPAAEAKGNKKDIDIHFIFGNGKYHVDGWYLSNNSQEYEKKLQYTFPTCTDSDAEIRNTIINHYNDYSNNGKPSQLASYNASHNPDCDFKSGCRILHAESIITKIQNLRDNKEIKTLTRPKPCESCSTLGIDALAGYFIDAFHKSVEQVGTQTVVIDPGGAPIVTGTHKKFKEWEEMPDHIAAVTKFSIDTVRVEKITSDEYTFVFDKNVTPVIYSRKEKRAILPSSSFLPPTNMKDSSGNEINILEVIKSKVSLSSGEQFVTTDSGDVVVKNLFIKDNYAIGDDDVFLASNWEPGMNGSVNVFTDIDKGESDSYGDDCYLVNNNSRLKIQGYTDAIIYDGEHSISAELNAYDFPTVNAIHSNGSVIVDNSTDISCNTFMFNRKDRARQYSGSGPYSHCVDLVECDRDIILSGLNNLITENPDPNGNTGGTGQEISKKKQYQVFDPMTNDIVGRIELWYRSPVLNYRFNIEDPDAKTSIYEILPDCNPQDNYLHVVLLHVYYARNVYISDGPDLLTLNGTPQTSFNYVASYGTDPIAYYGDPNLLDDNPGAAEGLYKWTLKMWQDPMHRDNGWYLDDFVWFQAEKMKKDIPYHDELPSNGMQPFYGLVNGRYTSKQQDGKQDLLVQVPQFNIPTTVMDYYIHYGGGDNPINWNGDGTHPMKIYIVLTEFHPKDALVSYKWDKDCRWVNPATGRVNDDITQDYRGCYATFSCDSVTYKDVEYYDLVETINFENQEIFDTKNNIIHYQLNKPETEYTYTNYYLKVSTDNSDVMALNYPSEIMFDEDGHADFGVTYKGVVNATTKWAPRIHNGYYYLNQHEYFAYSEFEFDRIKTNVEHNETEKCKTVFGHMTFDVTLCHNAPPPEYYTGNNAIIKDSRSSLLQNENQFQWVDGLGVTLKPKIDGEYYKEYETYMYYSPILSFPHTLTSHGPITLNYTIGDGTDELMGVEIRSYVLEDGKWSDWYPLAGVEVPCYPNFPYQIPLNVPLSHAYQVRFYLQASVKQHYKQIEDYLCCYLDWKDDGEESACYNIVTITDHITTGPYHGKGVFASRIFDYGCESIVYLDMFQSNYNSKIKLYVATSVDKNKLYMENATWQDISNGGSVRGRYMRYKIEIPEGEKLYWLHKKISTNETEAILPYVKGFKMEGEYCPGDIITNFINTEAFEIIADGTYHNLEEFSDITKIIQDDVLDRGYTMNEIKKVDIRCTTSNINILYDSNLLNEYPGAVLKDTKLRAKTPYQSFTDITYTPFIFLDNDESGCDKITIYGATPQQYCPITVEDPDGLSYIQLHDCTDFEQKLTIVCNDKTKYIELPTNRYDYLSMKIKLNGVSLSNTKYKIANHLIIFNDFLTIGDKIEVSYYIMYSFIATVDRYGDNITPPNTTIYLYTGHILNADNEPEYVTAATKYKIFFETGLRNNKFIANRLSLNPIYRTDYKGFIYLTDDNNEPYTVKIYCNPRRIQAGGFDKVDVAVEVLDILGNPVINREVYLDCGATNDDSNSFDRGIINCKNNMTDMNGVVHFIYESSILPVEAKIRASVFNCAGASIEDSITIVNE